MKESGIGYGSVNHPVDRDPVCGYSGIIVTFNIIEGDVNAASEIPSFWILTTGAVPIAALRPEDGT